MSRNDQAWAVFRCQLLAPLLLGEVPDSERRTYIRELSEQEFVLPNGRRKKLSARTLRRWWKRLREDGVEALQRQPRNDRGQFHYASQRKELFARAVELKREQPRRSAHVINQILLHEFHRTLPATTLYRHLRRQGATRQKLGVSDKKIRCRWSRDHSNSLWVGDFEHGPKVLHQGHAVSTRLSAWIDCHSRYVVKAQYYLSESFDVLVDSLLRAWGKHGASREIYVDNAKIYHAGSLKLACTKLNIRLLHRPPREPEPGGLIERFFQTLQIQLEAEVNAASLLRLEELNRALQVWLHSDYHQRVHSETKETPEQRYQAGTTAKRLVDVSSVDHFFRERVNRTVHRDHSDVQLDNRFFKVDPQLRGDQVIVQYDPFVPIDELPEVAIFDDRDVYLGRGVRYQRERDAHPQPEPKPAQPPIEPHYLDALEAKHQAEHQRARQTGLDFHSAQQRNTWTFSGWANQLAKYLGREGLSAFHDAELHALREFHTKHDRVTETQLRQAVAQADAKTIPQILWHLQQLLSQKEK